MFFRKDTKRGAAGGKPSNVQTESDNAVPDTQCAICLEDKKKYEVYSETCKHSFCFTCINNWSTRKHWCPFCKQSLTGILHDIEGEDKPCRHEVQPKKEGPPYDAMNGRMRLPRIVTRGMRMYTAMVSGATTKIVIPPPTYVTNRRRIYAEDLFAVETYPETVVTPRYFVENPGEYERVLTWIDRELQAIFLNCKLLQSSALPMIVITIMKEPLLSKKFRCKIRSYFGKLTRHFQHELSCFAASKLSIEDYNKVATYKSIPINRGKYSNDRNLDAVDILIPLLSKQLVFEDDSDESADVESNSNSEDEFDKYMPFQVDTSKFDACDRKIPIATIRFHHFAQSVPEYESFGEQSIPSDFDCLVGNEESGLRMILEDSK